MLFGKILEFILHDIAIMNHQSKLTRFSVDVGFDVVVNNYCYYWGEYDYLKFFWIYQKQSGFDILNHYFCRNLIVFGFVEIKSKYL